MTEKFVPPYPAPHPTKLSLLRRFVGIFKSWIHVLSQQSYTMSMGEIHLPKLNYYIVNELALVKKILSDAKTFPKHVFLQKMLRSLFGNSVFLSNGAEWEQQRVLIDPAFSQASLARVFPLMAAAVEDIIGRTGECDLAKPVHIDPLMTHVAADIIFRTLFSQALGDAEAREIHLAFGRHQRHAQRASLLGAYGLPTFGLDALTKRTARRIHALFAPIVRARFEAARSGQLPPADILQSLIEARDDATGASFGYEEVMEQVSIIFFAGHETSASAMTWALYLLAECPHLQAALREEARTAFAGAPPRYEAVKNLPLTRNVFREALRLYPPISFLLREVVCPLRMRDKDIAAGAMLVVSPWLIHRNPNNWEEPHAFDPDRFERPEARAACRDAYLPFGKGPRTCVGAGFAQQEAMLLLSAFVQAFELRPVPGDKPEPANRLTLRPKSGLRLALERRAG